MALESDYLVDRRRLKRRLALWRGLAVVIAVALVVVAVERFKGSSVRGGDYIARLHIDSVIFNDRDRIEALDKLVANSRARALILRINSPGGTVVGGEALYRALRKVADKKPVVAVMDGIATSGGYMAAIAAGRIFAHQASITGSIGVLFQTAEITELLEMIGVSVATIKSGPLKAEPSPITKLTPEAIRATQALVDDMFAMFVDMVADRRKMDRGRVLKLADGRVYTGRMAVANGLVDAIGGEPEALEWLRMEKKIDQGLPVRDLRIHRDVKAWFDRLTGLARKTVLSERLTLDGLVSVWHPRIN
ncbi:MAG: signal peptide peptidase SppA [Alphaproteobacteria bacterium]